MGFFRYFHVSEEAVIHIVSRFFVLDASQNLMACDSMDGSSK